MVLSALYKALYGSPTALYRWALFAITEVEKLKTSGFLPDTEIFCVNSSCRSYHSIFYNSDPITGPALREAG